MDDFVKSFKVFLATAIIEGVFSLVYLLAISSDPKTVWLLGYSRSRWALILFGLALIGILVGITIKTYHGSHWTERFTGKLQALSQKEATITILWLIFLVVFSLLIAVWWLSTSTRWTFHVDPAIYSFGSYLARLAPFLIWLELLVIQSLIMMARLGVRVLPSYRALQVASVLVFPVLLLLFKSLGEEHYREINKEDRLIEWLTFGVLVLTALLALIQGVFAKRKKNPAAYFLFLFSLACLLFAMEEISWGQRVFNLEVGEYFMEHSDQQEINIHNVVNKSFNVRTKYIAAWALMAYGIVSPLLAMVRKVGLFFDKVGFIPSPLVLIPGYLLAAGLTWDRFFTGQDEEVAEFFFSLLLCLVVIYQYWGSQTITDREVNAHVAGS